MNNMDSSLLESVLLSDPVSKRGKGALDRVKNVLSKDLSLDEFYEKGVYVEPFFKKLQEKGLNYGIKYDDKDDIPFLPLTDMDVITLSGKLKEFQALFNRQESDEILYIRASAGSGKSIFLNYLKRERRRMFYPKYINNPALSEKINEAYELSFDLEKASDMIYFGREEFPSSKYKCIRENTLKRNSQWHFFIMIMQSILDNIFDFIKSKDTCGIDYRKNFDRVYGYDYPDKIKDLWDYVFNTKFENDNDVIRNIRGNLLEKVSVACFDELRSKKNNSMNIENALRLLFRFYLIRSDIDNPKQLLISFDNIEHYIRSAKRIYDDDITQIVQSIMRIVESESKYFDRLDLRFARFFKIVLVARDTTEKMLGDIQDDFQKEKGSISISGWFLLEDIYLNKIKYYGLDRDSSLVKLFDLVASDGDDGLKNNLMNQVSTMYNHNNRRITRILSKIADSFNSKNNFVKDSISFNVFEKIWNYRGKGQIKYLCRQSVLKLIYNTINNSWYFYRIGANSEYLNRENSNGEKSNRDHLLENATLAPRILIWLANRNSHVSREYVSLKELYESIVKSLDVNGKYNFDNDLLDKLSSILINLDESKFAPPNILQKEKDKPGFNFWCQLLIIKYNDIDVEDKLEVSLLSNEIRKQCEGVGDNTIAGIRLTEAGWFYARKFCDFEFISCIYCNSKSKYNLPLIFMEKENDIISMIKGVYNCAKQLIYGWYDFEKNRFLGDFEESYKRDFHLKIETNSKNYIYQSIPYRIIDNHINYLEAYKVYLNENELQKEIGVYDSETIENLITFVDEYIGKYKEIEKDLEKSGYPMAKKEE